MDEKRFLETLFAHRHRLKCSTFVVRQGLRKWVCAVCEEPHDVLSPKREYLREWYRKRGKHQRIRYKNEGRCTNCGKTLVGSTSTVYCVACHAGRLATQRRARQRKALAIHEALYGGREDFQREEISPHPMNLTVRQITEGERG
jgi:hypothetical protein